MPPPSFQSRRTENLRQGRVSIPGATYFLTWCTAQRAPVLVKPALFSTCREAIASIDLQGDGTVLAATIMPEHIHVLLELGGRLTVSQIVSKTKAAISRVHSGLQWQENVFEHQVRTSESAQSLAFYIFMNPYCAGLCALNEP